MEDLHVLCKEAGRVGHRRHVEAVECFAGEATNSVLVYWRLQQGCEEEVAHLLFDRRDGAHGSSRGLRSMSLLTTCCIAGPLHMRCGCLFRVVRITARC